MRHTRLFALIALMLAFTMVFAACGKEEAKPNGDTFQEDQPLGLSDWELSAETWSSPNGATVNLSAAPTRRAEGDSAVFLVRLEGEQIASADCDWDGSAYTGSLDLNAADGYCYYVVLTDAAGEELEVAVNTPTDPVDETLIDMESSLNSYCAIQVSDFACDGKWLTITEGRLEVQPPRIANGGEAVLCSEAVLVLSHNGEEVSSVSLALPDPDVTGGYTVDLSSPAFQIPAMEDDEQLILRLDVSLSNGQSLTAPGGTWVCNDGQLLMAVG